MGRWAPCSCTETEGRGRALTGGATGGPEHGACTTGAGSLVLWLGGPVLASKPVPGGRDGQPDRQWIGLDPVNPAASHRPADQPSKVGIRSCYPDTFPTLFALHAYIPGRYLGNLGGGGAAIEGSKSRHDATAQPRQPQPGTARQGTTRHDTSIANQTAAAAAAAAAAKPTVGNPTRRWESTESPAKPWAAAANATHSLADEKETAAPSPLALALAREPMQCRCNHEQPALAASQVRLMSG